SFLACIWRSFPGGSGLVSSGSGFVCRGSLAFGSRCVLGLCGNFRKRRGIVREGTHVGDQIGAVLRVLQARERHGRTAYEALRREQELIQMLVVPYDRA